MKRKSQKRDGGNVSVNLGKKKCMSVLIYVTTISKGDRASTGRKSPAKKDDVAKWGTQTHSSEGIAFGREGRHEMTGPQRPTHQKGGRCCKWGGEGMERGREGFAVARRTLREGSSRGEGIVWGGLLPS